MGTERGLHLGHFFDKESDRFGAERRVYEGDRHAILFGPSGSGKFTRLLAVNLLSNCLDDRSVLVIDPKGEAAAVTAWHRHQLGHDVKILDPFGVVHAAVEDSPAHQEMIEAGLTQGVGFEPLDAVTPGTLAKPNLNFYDEATKLGDALIRIDADDREKHWSESAQALAVGFLMWEKLRNGQTANLENVRMMLTNGKLANTVTEIITQADTPELRGMGGAAVTSLLARFLQETNEMAGIRSTADTQTRWMLSQPMGASFTATRRIDFRRLKERLTTIYVVLPAGYLRTHSIWLRLVLVCALQALYRPGGLPVVALIDEMAALGHLGPLEDAFGLVRGYGAQLVGILQDLPQLKELYNKRWQSFLANVGVVQFFTPNDLETAKWMQDRAGATTAWAMSMSRSGYESHVGAGPGFVNNVNESWNQTRVDVFPTSELFGLPVGTGLAWFAGLDSTVNFFTPNYWELKQCRARALPNPYAPG
jgi:type IV secretion system protein VirD4